MSVNVNSSGTGTGNADPNANAGAEGGATGSQQQQGQAGAQGNGEGKKGGLDLATLPQEAQDYIKSLRSEAGQYRTKAKDLEGKLNGINQALGGAPDVKPEEALAALTQQHEGLAVEHAIAMAAIENGVGADQLSYFKFLVAEASNQLEDGQELDLAPILTQVKAVGGSKGPAHTGVGGKGGANPPKPDDGTVTLEQFKAMGIVNKAKLQASNPGLYSSLAEQLRATYQK